MEPNTKTAEQLASEVKASFASQMDTVKSIAEQALGEAKVNHEVSTKTKETADEALVKLNGLSAQITDIEQKLASHREILEVAKKTLGEQFVENEQVKSFLASGMKGRIDLQFKAALTSLTTDAAGSAGDAVRPTRLDGINMPNQRRLTVRDLLMQGRMDSNAIEYPKETGFTNNAASVAENTAKAQSDFKLDLVTVGAKTIAHTVKASRQILDDAPMLMSYIDGRLRYGLKYKEELQILNGDGTGQNLNGIVTQATAFSAPFTIADATTIDKLRLAALQATLAEYPASAIVINPMDWAQIETLKDTTGQYIIGNPQGTLSPTLWGLPVVATQAMTVDKFLVGAFNMGAQIFDRWDSRVELATQNEDDFIKNMVTILCEERLALAVYRPEAFVYGDFGLVA